jgi:lysozyme family protein
MGDFDTWLTFAVGADETQPGGEEGGWTPDDPSTDNPTMRGVWYSEWCDWIGMPRGVPSFTTFQASCSRTVVGQIALAKYWNAYHVALLPSGPNILYMDGVWNGGGVENLQTTINAILHLHLVVDNVLGPQTLSEMRALANVLPRTTINTYTAAADARYRNLGKPQFLSDWLGRLGRCKALALGLLSP